MYSLSSANPSCPASLLMATTGKTTLMACAVTPRVLVLAWLTGVGADEAETGTTAAPAPSGEPGVPDGARASQTISPTTTASTMSTVRICMARGRRRRRRQLRPSGRSGLGGRIHPVCADMFMVVTALPLIHGPSPVRCGRRAVDARSRRPGGQERLVAGTKVGRQRPRVGAHHLGRAVGHHPPQLHDHHAGAELEDERDVVLDEDDGRVGDLVQAPQERDEGLGLALGDAGRGLVEQEQARLGQDDGGQVHHTARPRGELGRAVMPEALQPEGADHLIDRGPLALLGRGAPRAAARWSRGRQPRA